MKVSEATHVLFTLLLAKKSTKTNSFHVLRISIFAAEIFIRIA